MNLKVQKRLAAQILECSPKKVVFDNERLDEIKQAITKRDLKLLIGSGAIRVAPGNYTSKVRVRKIKIQKSKGRRKGPGSKKGSFKARFRKKLSWMRNLRVQRAFLKMLVSKNIIDKKAYRKLYLMSKGGYFRSKRHIKLFLEEHEELILSKNNISENESQSKTKNKSKGTTRNESKDLSLNESKKEFGINSTNQSKSSKKENIFKS